MYISTRQNNILDLILDKLLHLITAPNPFKVALFEIIRFNSLDFSDGRLSNSDEFDAILKKLKELQSAKKVIKVKISKVFPF